MRQSSEMGSTVHRRLRLALMTTVVLVAACLRLWQLPEVPPGLWHDEAYNGMDAIRMLETHSPQIFFPGNDGREPMFLYLQALSISVLGIMPYALRLVSALTGILTVPLIYRWVVSFYAQDADRHWLGLMAAAGLAFSLWHVTMSRSGYRAILFPPFVILTCHLFWRGWQRRSLLYFAGAGVALGLSQYTYLSVRLLPLVFGLFGVLWLLLTKMRLARSAEATGPFASVPSSAQKALWLGLLVMVAFSFIVFLPLGLFFVKNPVAFYSRTNDVFILRSAQGQTITLLNQLADAVRVFIDGYDPNWRHGLVGQPSFGWLDLMAFWIGLWVIARRFREPGPLFLLVSLFVLWLPAPLSVPAVHALRLSGLLPAYYTIAAVGLLAVIRRIASLLTRRSAALSVRLGAFALVLCVSGGFTAYNYFARWARQPEVYTEFSGPLVDLVRRIIAESRNADVLLPFGTYVKPTTRFQLHGFFRESATLPRLDTSRLTWLVTMPDISSSDYVWLTRDESGRGIAYVGHTLLPADLAALVPSGEAIHLLNPYTSETIASLTPLESVGPVRSALTDWQSLSPVDYNWEHHIQLVGYQVWPGWVQPGQSPTLELYWKSLVEQPLEYTIFIQLVNGHGDPIGQQNEPFFSYEHRWRIGGIIPDPRRLWMGAQTAPGPYLARMGLFDLTTGQRLPVYASDGRVLGDQVVLGLFYVAQGDRDPRQPQNPLRARLGESIELMGYSLPPVPDGQSMLRVQLHWRANNPVDGDYTIFVQLLDSQNYLVTSWDSQPLAGQYPTSHWQPGEIVVDEFDLPLPGELPSGDYRLVTGMYDLASSRRLPAAGADGRPLPGNMIVLLQEHLAQQVRQGLFVSEERSWLPADLQPIISNLKPVGWPSLSLF